MSRSDQSDLPLGDADGLIAATAKVHDLILVTRNVADFDDARRLDRQHPGRSIDPIDACSLFIDGDQTNS